MNEKTLSFTNTPDVDKPPSSLIKVTYAEAKPDSSSGSSHGSVASEDNLQQAPNDFSRHKGGLEAGTSGSRSALSQKDRARPSIMPQDPTENTQSNKPFSWLQPEQTEKGSSQTSNLSIGFLPVSPIMNRTVSSNQPRRPSRFYTITDEKESGNFSSAVVKERRMSPAHISKSQEFLQVSPQIEIDTDQEPATATLVKKPRPSMLAGFKLLNSSKNDSRDSIRPLKASQMNLIDDKVSVNSVENRKSGLLPPPLERKSTRKSKLLDKISLIAAKGDSGDDTNRDNPALIFKQVLKKVNPHSLQKAEKNIRRRFLLKVRRKILAVAKSPFQVFSPEDSFSLLRNMLTPAMITIDTFLAPFMISFYPEGRYDTFLELGAIITVFFILDIFVNFRTAFYDKGLLIIDSKEITKHYLRKRFTADFIVILADILAIFYYDTFLWYAKFLSIIRLKKLFNIITGLEDYLIMSRTWNALLKLLKLWGGILVVAHWLACIFHMIAYETQGEERTWLERLNLQYALVTDKYIAAFFWSITTMVTVGYGDIVPVSNIERIYVVIAMIMSSALFGYTLNTVGDIIREMSYEKDQKREKNRSVRKYMSQKNLGKGIQTRVKNYLQYMIESRMLYKHDDEEFFSLLSQNLKDEIISEVNGKILAESKLFSINFTAKATSRLARYMKEIFKSPEENIFEEGDDNDHSIYFIVYGKVQIDYRAKKVRVLEKGANFGDISFFAGQPRNASAKSLFFTNMYSLDRETAMEKLRTLPSDFEMFHFIKDSINLYKDYSHLHIQCYSCDQKGHLARDCPEIHFNADREEIIKNYVNRQSILKKKFSRLPRPRFHVRGNLKSLESIAKMIQEDYNDYTVSDEELSQDSLDIVLERNLILIPGGEMNDMKNRKMDRRKKSARASINLVYEQVNNANEIIGRRTSQLLSQNLIPEKRESVYDPMSLKSTTGEHIFFSIDKVENFELYFPQNNVIKLITEFDKIMFEQLLESKQGIAKALVIRNFGAMLRSNKGPHKSPLFYANLKKETIIQRGRKKMEAPEVKPQPIQRLGTLMKTVLSNKKKQSKAMRNSKLKVFYEDQIVLSSGDKSRSSDDEESEYAKVLIKAGTLDNNNDEATIPRSDRMYEKKQTNPSSYMGKLNSLNPKMITGTKSELDAHKWTSRTSSIDSPFPKSTPKLGEESKDKSAEASKEKTTKRDRIIHLFAENRVTEENEDGKSSQRNSKHRKSSRCSSQGRLDDVQKLVDKLDIDNGLVQRMVERRLSKRVTAYFGF